MTVKNNQIIVHYCCDSYMYGAHGGVPRFDYQIWLAFPNRIFFRQQQTRELLVFLHQHPNAIVITDNHLSCDIPKNIKVILVHHGCAKTTFDRNPENGEDFYKFFVVRQKEMLEYRDPKNTTIVSISKACTDDFTNYYGQLYTKFPRQLILHPSELQEDRFKTVFNNQPIVLGNWRGAKKGEGLINTLRNNITNFKFQQLQIGIDQRGIENFNQRKQDIYLASDIFLQISNSEGNSYATLDALICGLPIVSSNVGLFYGDVPEDCFVKLEWERNGDAEYVQSKLEYAWKNRETLSKNARNWYLNNCCLEEWKKKFQQLLANF